MSQKVIPFLRHKRQAIRDVRAKLQSFQSRDGINQKTQIYTLKEICDQVQGILKQEKFVTEKDLDNVTKLSSLTQVLTFLRHFSEGFRNSLNAKETLESRGTCCQFFAQKKELKQKLQSKNQTILRLNQGYQEVKAFYSKQLLINESIITDLKADVFKLKSQKQILKQKVEILLNFREAMVKSALRQQKGQLCVHHNPQDQKHQVTSSQKSSFHDIKDILSVLQTKTQSKQSQKRIINGISFNRNRMQESIQSQPLKSINETSPIRPKKSQKKNNRQNIEDNSSSLINEIAILRQNQSNLLDRICQRDYMISQLLKTKGMSFHSETAL